MYCGERERVATSEKKGHQISACTRYAICKKNSKKILFLIKMNTNFCSQSGITENKTKKKNGQGVCVQTGVCTESCSTFLSSSVIGFTHI